MEESQVNKRLRVRDIIICSDCDRGFDPRYVWAVVLTTLYILPDALKEL